MQFYSYLWLLEDGTPYYAGKGSGRRAFKARQKSVSPPKDRSLILVFPHASEAEAFDSEKAFIKWFGRKDNSTGCLCNLTDGGEGLANKSEIVLQAMKKNGQIQGRKAVETGQIQALGARVKREGLGIFAPTYDRIPNGRATGLKMKEQGRGIFGISAEQHAKQVAKSGQTNIRTGHIQRLGQTQGLKNIENGHLKRLRTKEHQSRAARSARHNQWHVRRGIINPKCALCVAAKELIL